MAKCKALMGSAVKGLSRKCAVLQTLEVWSARAKWVSRVTTRVTILWDRGMLPSV